MKMMRRIYAAVIVTLLVSGCVLATDRHVCSPDNAVQAEEESDSLASWDALYDSFKKYASCDDAAIAEGYSDTVVRLLVHKWGTFSRLVEITASDREFREFVLRHLNELMSPAQARKIYKNTRMRCPASGAELCHQIQRRLEELPVPIVNRPGF